MTLSTITIATVAYVSNATVAQADALLAVDAARAVTWATKTTDEKGALLVQATKRFNLLVWEGTKTGGDTQDDAWPRTGSTYSSGGEVSTTEVPQGVEDGTILLAGSIALDADTGDVGTSGSNVKNVKAGSTGVTFFREKTGVPLADETAYALVKEFLASSGAFGSGIGAMSSGTNTTDTFANSSFNDRDAWGRNVGFP